MAIERHGSFKARALASGKSPGDFAEQHLKSEGNVGKLARLYHTAQSPGASGKAKMDEPGDNRKKRNPLYQVG